MNHPARTRMRARGGPLRFTFQRPTWWGPRESNPVDRGRGIGFTGRSSSILSMSPSAIRYFERHTSSAAGGSRTRLVRSGAPVPHQLGHSRIHNFKLGAPTRTRTGAAGLRNRCSTTRALGANRGGPPRSRTPLAGFGDQPHPGWQPRNGKAGRPFGHPASRERARGSFRGRVVRTGADRDNRDSRIPWLRASRGFFRDGIEWQPRERPRRGPASCRPCPNDAGRATSLTATSAAPRPARSASGRRSTAHRPRSPSGR